MWNPSVVPFFHKNKQNPRQNTVKPVPKAPQTAITVRIHLSTIRQERFSLKATVHLRTISGPSSDHPSRECQPRSNCSSRAHPSWQLDISGPSVKSKSASKQPFLSGPSSKNPHTHSLTHTLTHTHSIKHKHIHPQACIAAQGHHEKSISHDSPHKHHANKSHPKHHANNRPLVLPCWPT